MSRSCGTCRDRRVSCDRGVPVCTQCVRANRACKGYGIRLSWPRANDARRAVVGRPLRRSTGRQPGPSRPYHVNASSWDIELHHYLLGLSSNAYARVALRVPMPFNPMTYDDADNQLLQYFQYTASQALPILGHNPTTLGGILLRMALTTTSPSAAAVRLAILGLSSLHRYGLQGQAFELKIAAIKSLGAASNSDIGVTEAIQHVAAGMLLCSFEIHKASCTSGEWRWYITGVQSVITSSRLAHFSRDPDLGVLLDWVYYQNALLQFSSLHWRPDLDVQPSLSDATTDRLGDKIATSPSNSSSLNTLLDILVDGCNALSMKHTSNYHNSLQLLGSKLRALPISTSNPTLEIFHLATIVYLNRITDHLLEPASETQQRISQAFTIFPSLKTCERQFPLFLLGCEASTDDERRMVLDLIDRTEQSASSRSLFLTREFIQKIWVQDDLADGGLDYGGKLSAILGLCAILPSFV